MDYLMISLGAVIALLERYVSAQSKRNFHFGIFLRKNLPLFLFNLVAALGFMLAFTHYNQDFQFIEGKDVLTGFLWLGLGALSHYVWKLFIGAFKLITKNFLNKITKNTGNDYNNRNSR